MTELVEEYRSRFDKEITTGEKVASSPAWEKARKLSATSMWPQPCDYVTLTGYEGARLGDWVMINGSRFYITRIAPDGALTLRPQNGR
jgi:hypothetical protein